jgi:hypothetical protein
MKNLFLLKENNNNNETIIMPITRSFSNNTLLNIMPSCSSSLVDSSNKSLFNIFS